MYDDTNTGTTFLYELARDRETSELVGYLKRGRKPVIRSRAAELLADFRDVSAQQEREEIIHGLIPQSSTTMMTRFVHGQSMPCSALETMRSNG